MKYIHIKILTAVALFACYMIALLTLQDHVIYYQEQHSLFLFSKYYFEQTVHSSGLIGYIGAFITQFYYYPWLGAGIVSLLACCIYLSIESIISRITGKRDFLQLGVIPAIAMYYTLDNIDESPAWLVIVAFGLFILWCLTFIFFKPKPQKIYNSRMRLLQTIMSLLLPAIYLCVGFWIEVGLYDKAERAMIRAERAIKKQNWDEAIDITSKYLSTGRNNKLMLYLRSLALAHKGELIDHLFDYPQKVGQQALAFPWTSNSRETEYGHWVHETTGDINAAHQWAFEAMTVWGETSSHLYDLGRYNVALGRPRVARKFADKLGQTLFYRDKANEIKKAIENPDILDLNYNEVDAPQTKWINIADFRPNLMQNYLADPSDEITRQYLIASMLLSNNLRILIPMLRTSDMESETIREAILIYSLDPQALPLSKFGLKIDENTGNRFAEFYKLLKQSDRRQLEQKYGRTYWFYKHTINPIENG